MTKKEMINKLQAVGIITSQKDAKILSRYSFEKLDKVYNELMVDRLRELTTVYYIERR